MDNRPSADVDRSNTPRQSGTARRPEKRGRRFLEHGPACEDVFTASMKGRTATANEEYDRTGSTASVRGSQSAQGDPNNLEGLASGPRDKSLRSDVYTKSYSVRRDDDFGVLEARELNSNRSPRTAATCSRRLKELARRQRTDLHSGTRRDEFVALQHRTEQYSRPLSSQAFEA